MMETLIKTLSPQAWFEYGYYQMTGSQATHFRFVVGETPLSTYEEVVVVMAVYLAVIFGGQHFMKGQKPIQLSFLFQIHNWFLTVLSLGLFLLFTENVIPMIYQDGLFNSICSPSNFTQKLELLYYINYLTKFYELIDTVFLVIRKKELRFLHWFHHSMTALLCFTQLNARNTVSWVPVTLNLGVHVFMYYYYFLATFNIKVWWKRYITVLQITQFVIDLVAIYFCLYHIAVHHFNLELPNLGDCSGHNGASLFGAGLLSSYLLLFVQFFYTTYTTKPRPTKSNHTEKSITPVDNKKS